MFCQCCSIATTVHGNNTVRAFCGNWVASDQQYTISSIFNKRQGNLGLFLINTKVWIQF
uniref:Uncharacterized protein n=1 Tax=Anguilla anguilla TaxID=7936 RepID=A0A0E9XCT0_ANGAN